jgi:thioredoxin-related protein
MKYTIAALMISFVGTANDAEDKPYLYVFTGPGCPTCIKFKRDYNSDPAFQRELKSKARVCFIDEGPKGDEYRRAYHVSVVPTFIMIDPKTRKPLQVHTGYSQKSDITGLAKTIFDKLFPNPQQRYQGLPPQREGQDFGDRLKEGAGQLGMQFGQQVLQKRENQIAMSRVKDWGFLSVLAVIAVGYWYKKRKEDEIAELNTKLRLLEQRLHLPEDKKEE